MIPPYALIWTGWRRRREAQWHKRPMLSAAILVVMGPAIGRLPIAPPTLGGFTFQLLLGLAAVRAAVPLGPAQPGQVHPATWLGFSMAALSLLVPLLIFWTGADWASIARQFPGFRRLAALAFEPNRASP